MTHVPHLHNLCHLDTGKVATHAPSRGRTQRICLTRYIQLKKSNLNKISVLNYKKTLLFRNDVDFSAEVGDGPDKVMMDILLLVSVAPTGRLYRRLPGQDLDTLATAPTSLCNDTETGIVKNLNFSKNLALIGLIKSTLFIE